MQKYTNEEELLYRNLSSKSYNDHKITKYNTNENGFVGLYDFKKTIGTGTYGQVKVAEHVLTKVI